MLTKPGVRSPSVAFWSNEHEVINHFPGLFYFSLSAPSKITYTSESICTNSVKEVPGTGGSHG